ncbi:hypothetical protein ElyMa_000067000 [Elysia marginata]|uniref:SMB domain-containing protein n=1 Tax=Elysia marginata TaxID=1093978 RepID=A0AAV4EH22_9GAST|nr:hypothetical protein ElyMa_000067000 [Elysia marginata]
MTQRLSILLYLFATCVDADTSILSPTTEAVGIAMGHQSSTTEGKLHVTQSSYASLFTSTEKTYTLDYLRFSPRCRENATDFVYKNNLCNAATDPKNYLNSNKERYSCLGRCGHARPYSKQGQEMCACDPLCVLHNDCCRDMKIACPQEYATGKNTIANFQYPKPFCYLSRRPADFFFVASCPSLNNDQSESVETNWLSSQINDRPRSETSPTTQNTVQQLSGPLASFKVADPSVSVGLVYEDEFVYHYCSLSKATPYFLPKIIPLDCSNSPPVAADNSSVFQVLKWCTPLDVEDAITRFHRNCQQKIFVRCKCEENERFHDLIHNACIGYDQEVPVPGRLALQSNIPIGMQEHFKDKRCTITKLQTNSRVLSQTSKPVSENEKKLRLQMSVSPLPSSHRTGSYDSNDAIASGHDDATARRRGLNASVRTFEHESMTRSKNKVSFASEEDNLIFVVELNGTAERRFLCESLRDYLSECQLVDCADGRILWHDPQRYRHLGGYKCLSPAKVVLKRTADPNETVPLCLCQHILGVFSNEETWIIRMTIDRRSRCIYHFILPKEGKRN